MERSVCLGHRFLVLYRSRIFGFSFYLDFPKKPNPKIPRPLHARKIPGQLDVAMFYIRCSTPFFPFGQMSSDSFRWPPSPSLMILIKVERRISLALFSILEM